MRFLSFVVLLTTCLPTAFAQEEIGKEMWLFWQNNLANQKSVDELEKLIDRAGPLGFTHLVISDTRSNHLQDLWHDEPVRYPKNVERIKAACAKYNMKIVPACFDIGYSNGSLWNDPNLAEGTPVVDQEFVVKDGVAQPAGKEIVLNTAKPDLVDPTVTMENGVATAKDHKGNARINWQLKGLPKNRAYHVSVKIKSDAYTGQPEIKPIGAKGVLQYYSFKWERTQDWTDTHIVFNTLDNDAVTLYFGQWGDAKGTLQWKDFKMEESPLVNIIRRPGCPLEVKLVKEDGSTVLLLEGTDYVPVADPKLGTVPWKGAYTVWHEAAEIKIKDKAKIPDGSTLRVSWYHAVITVGDQVGICMSEPKTNELLAETAKRIKAMWGNEYSFMEHDEVRHANHCKACKDRNITTGQMLAENVRYCTKLMEGTKVHVWADMFDPHHNAVDNYWLAGDIRGSWEGLDKSVVPILWYHDVRDKSMEFFGGRGHEMLISIHYDNDDPTKIKSWLDSAKKHKGIRGVMYTTWANNHGNIESFAKHVKAYRDN
jgi:hypothetical protein